MVDPINYAELYKPMQWYTYFQNVTSTSKIQVIKESIMSVRVG